MKSPCLLFSILSLTFHIVNADVSPCSEVLVPTKFIRIYENTTQSFSVPPDYLATTEGGRLDTLAVFENLFEDGYEVEKCRIWFTLPHNSEVFTKPPTLPNNQNLHVFAVPRFPDPDNGPPVYDWVNMYSQWGDRPDDDYHKDDFLERDIYKDTAQIIYEGPCPIRSGWDHASVVVHLTIDKVDWPGNIYKGEPNPLSEIYFQQINDPDPNAREGFWIQRFTGC